MGLLASVRRITLVRGALPLATSLFLATAALAATVTYTVDPGSGRVTRADYADGSYVIYTYDANGNRTAATVTLAVDTTAPTAPGSLSFSSITATSATATWTAATDNVVVTSYEWSTNAGSSWTNVGNLLSTSLAGLNGSTGYTVLVRARDAANNASPSISSSFSTLDNTAPSAPGTPIFSSITGTTAMASWAGATDNVGVTGYESRLDSGTWTAGASPRSLTGLTNGTAYTFSVRARDAAGNWGNPSSAILTTLDTAAPGQPGTPAISSITATTATATWTAATDNVGVTGYEYQLNGGSWTAAASPQSLSGLTNGTSYTFAVRARDAAGNWGSPSSTSFSTSDTAAPSAPGVPTFTNVAQTSATISWTAATDNVGVTGYQYRLNGGSWNGASSGVTVSGLAASTLYNVEVRARDAAGNWGGSSSASFTTVAAPDTTAPSAPGTPSFSSITGTSVTASWAAATDNVAVTGYEYSINAGASWVTASSGVSIAGLTNGTTYTVLVRARDAAGNWGNPSSASFTTTDTAAPSAPGTPSFSSITGTSVVASWSAATDNVGVTGYEYSINGGSSWVGATSGVSIAGLTNGTSYTAQVRARDAAGNWSSPSSATFSTTDTAAPSAPGTPSFSSITGTTVVVSWSAATDNVGVTAYEYSINGGSSWVSASSGVSITGLTNGTSYTVQVRARDAAGNWSSPSSASFSTTDTAAPTTPGSPGFTSITASSATASWGASTDNVGVVEYQYAVNSGGWTSNGASTSVALSGLAQATTHTVYVRARDAAGNWSSYSQNSFSTPDVTAPSAPGTPSFSSIGATSAVVSFSAASDNVGVAGYEYQLNGGGWSGASSGMTLSGLATAASYTVNVRAYDAAGNRGTSSSASFSTVDNVPPSVSGTPSFSSIGSTTAVASWGAASDNIGVTRYEYSVNGGGWVNVGNTTSATVSGLSAAASNTVAVRAVDGAGNAGGSSSGSVTTIAQITIANRNINTVAMGFSGGAAVYQLRSTGDLWASSSSATVTDVGDWLTPMSGMSNFQVMGTLVSGTACSSGTMNSWLSLGSHVAWAMGRGGPSGTSSCTFDLQIRHSSNPTVILGTARIGLTITN
jgi:YD repeat-containing protein